MLDREKVTDWVYDLFGTREVTTATFAHGDIPRAEVKVNEPVSGHIGQELCELLNLNPAEVRSVKIDQRGATVEVNDLGSIWQAERFIPFSDIDYDAA